MINVKTKESISTKNKISRALSRFTLKTMLLISSYLFTNIAHAEPIIIDNARINPTVPGLKVTALYFDIKNNSDKDITLTSASSSVSERLEIHEHIMESGLMRMQQVTAGITIPAGEEIAFAPGGYHVMVMNLSEMIAPQSKTHFILEFSNGKKLKLTAEAKRPSASKPQHKHGDPAKHRDTHTHKDAHTHKHH